jgi:FMN-dependent NADH-azoreductase
MNVLSIQSSISNSASVTRTLSAAYIERLRTNQLVRANQLELVIVERDLATEPLPHLGSNMVSVQLGMSADASQASLLSDQLISELERCDVLVIGSPMYNFGIPSTLKAWFDHVIRVGRTFRYVDGMPQGLLPLGKKAVVFVASGGVYSEGPGRPIDFLEPHLHWLLNFIGITDIEFIRAEGMALGAEAVKAAMDVALGQAVALAAWTK